MRLRFERCGVACKSSTSPPTQRHSRATSTTTARLQQELDELKLHLRATVGPNGRSRRFDDANERARTSVQKAIRRAVAAIGRDCPGMGAALQASVKTGYHCRYDPAPGAPERWAVRAAEVSA